MHAVTARPGRDPRFPQDRRASWRAEAPWSSGPLASEPEGLLVNAERPAGIEAGWLSYGCEAVLGSFLFEAANGPEAQAARALGLLARAAEEADALWRAVPDGKGLIAPPHLLTAMAAEHGGFGPPLQLAWGSWLCPVPDEVTLRRELGAPETLTALRARLAGWADEARSLGVSDASRAVVESFLGGLRERWECALATSWLWRYQPGGWDAPRIRGERERTMRMARSGLLADERLHEAWEEQRWGLWCEEPRVARLFPVGLCLMALAAAEVDVSAAAAELLSTEGRADGFGYYGRWLGIAPDAYDLGLALQLLPLAGDTPERRRTFERPVEVLLHNTHPDGWIPTYLEEGLLEPKTPDGPHWLVRRCSAVVANALIGLLCTDWPLPEGFRDRVLERLLAVLRDEGLTSVIAYPACYARLVLARLERALDGRSCPAAARAALGEMLASIEHELLATQGLDGGWGSPLATACHLATLSLRRTPGFDPSAAVLYLCARQEPDGLWPREAFYHCPGRDNAPHDYATRSVTAAICLEALALAGPRLPGGEATSG